MECKGSIFLRRIITWLVLRLAFLCWIGGLDSKVWKLDSKLVVVDSKFINLDSKSREVDSK